MSMADVLDTQKEGLIKIFVLKIIEKNYSNINNI